MRYLLSFFFVLSYTLVYSQTQPPIQMGSKLYQFRNGVKVDSAFFLPRRDTTNSDGNMLAPGMLQWRPGDQSFYGRDSTGWFRLSKGADAAKYRIDSTVSTIADLSSLSGDPGAAVIVTEDGRGGVFAWTAEGAANGGTKFTASNGIWNRIDTTVTGIYNVKWWGAKGDYDLTIGTNDAPAIQACANYLASIKTAAFIPTLYFPDSRFYLISAPITVSSGINVIVGGGDIVYNGPNTETALTIGASGQATSRVIIRVKIRQRSVPAWTDPNVVANNIGVKIINAQNAKIDIPLTAFFCNNIVFEGNNTGGSESGFAYNDITIGTSLDAMRHLTLTTDGTVGWINENKFNAGNFQNSSSTSSRQESRYGITVRTNSSAVPNNNVFYKPCFQLGHSSIPDKVADSAIAIMIEKGNANSFYDIRSENSGPVLMVCKDLSFGNYAYANIFGLDNNFQLLDLSSSRNNHVVSDLAKYTGPESGATLIFSSGFLPDKINQYDAATYYIQGVSWTHIPDGNVYPSGAGVAVSPDHIGISSSQRMGVFIDTRVAKNFALKWDVLNEQGGRIFVRLYDAAGAVTTDSTLLSPVFFSNNQVDTYGGGFVTGTDNPGRYFYFGVDTSIKKVYVAISGGTDSLLIKSWQLYSLNNLTAAVYSGLQEKGGFGQAAIMPTEVKPAGTIVYNDLSVDTTVMAWQNTDGTTLWSPIYRGEAKGNYVQINPSGIQPGFFDISEFGIAREGFIVQRDGSTGSFVQSYNLFNQAGTAGANIQLTGEGIPGMAMWVHDGTDYVERMRINSNGQVAIGTTSHPSGRKLAVVGGAYIDDSSPLRLNVSGLYTTTRIWATDTDITIMPVDHTILLETANTGTTQNITLPDPAPSTNQGRILVFIENSSDTWNLNYTVINPGAAAFTVLPANTTTILQVINNQWYKIK